MSYGGYPLGTVPYGSEQGRDVDKNIVNVPVSVITLTAPNPIVAVEFQYTIRKHNALERSSPCPE